MQLENRFKYLHVGFNFGGNPILIDELKPVFDTAKDWYRYVGNCWIVYTDETAQQWYEKLKPFLREKDNVFVAEMNISNRQGWMRKGFWEWLTASR